MRRHHLVSALLLVSYGAIHGTNGILDLNTGSMVSELKVVSTIPSRDIEIEPR